MLAQGLFEEESNSNLQAAMTAYRSVIGQLIIQLEAESEKGLAGIRIRKSEVERQLAQKEKALGLAEEKAQAARERLVAVETIHPIRLPSEVAKDERYQKLRKEFESYVLRGSDQASADSQSGLSKWVNEIYKPELEAECKFRESTLRDAMMGLRDAQIENEEFTRVEMEVRSEMSQHPIERLIKRNLRNIEAAKEDLDISTTKKNGDLVTEKDLGPFLKDGDFPESLDGELYSLNPIGESATATLTRPLGNLPAGTVIEIQKK